MMEDQGTTYRIFQQCSKVAYRPVPLYYYYQRPDSILHRRNMKFYEDKLDMATRSTGPSGKRTRECQRMMPPC